MNIKVGTILNDRYQIVSELGAGGFAIVYRGRDILLGRDVAIKIMRPMADREVLMRFQQEAQLLGTIQNKNIVSVYAFGLSDEDAPYMVMEHLAGESLHGQLQKGGALGYAFLKKILTQCCEGLAAAHEAGIVHRDLSSTNIFLLNDGSESLVKILDFGLSKLLSGNSSSPNLTASGAVLGNPTFISPEQIRGEQVDLRSDIYSLGCILYECLCGQPAFDSESSIGYLHKHQTEYPREPVFDWQDKEKEKLMKSIALRCIQKAPENRFQSAREILNVLSSGDDLPGKPKDSWSNVPAQEQKQFAAKFSIAGVVITLSIITIVFFDSICGLLIDLIAPAGTQSLATAEYAIAESCLQHRKPALTLKLGAKLSSFYAAQKDYLHLANSRLLEAEAYEQQNKSEQATKAIQEALDACSEIKGTQAASDLLARIMATINALKTTAVSPLSLLRLHDSVLDQMLNNKYTRRSDQRWCVGTVFGFFDANPDFAGPNSKQPDRETLIVTAKAATHYLNNLNEPVSYREKRFLRILSNLCISKNLKDQAELLDRARLARLKVSTESPIEIWFDLAISLYEKNLKEAIGILHKIREYPDITDDQVGLSLRREIELKEKTASPEEIAKLLKQAEALGPATFAADVEYFRNERLKILDKPRKH